MAWEVEVAQTYYAWGYYSSQAQNNARLMWGWFNGRMTLEAAIGIIANACYESHGLNPGQKQVPSGAGWGLIQWTPSSSLTNYVNDWKDGDEQCELIIREGQRDPTLGGARFFPSRLHPQYDYSWSEYCQITDIYEATRAYLWERERPSERYAVDSLPTRDEFASFYYELLSGEEPPIPPEPPDPPTPTTRKKMPLYMMCRRI